MKTIYISDRANNNNNTQNTEQFFCQSHLTHNYSGIKCATKIKKLFVQKHRKIEIKIGKTGKKCRHMQRTREEYHKLHKYNAHCQIEIDTELHKKRKTERERAWVCVHIFASIKDISEK